MPLPDFVYALQVARMKQSAMRESSLAARSVYTALAVAYAVTGRQSEAEASLRNARKLFQTQAGE